MQFSQWPQQKRQAATTRSPGLNAVTPAPTASTTPQASWPIGSAGTPCGSGNSSRMCTSEPQIVLSVMRITAWSGPGSAIGSSAIAS